MSEQQTPSNEELEAQRRARRWPDPIPAPEPIDQAQVEAARRAARWPQQD